MKCACPITTFTSSGLSTVTTSQDNVVSVTPHAATVRMPDRAGARGAGRGEDGGVSPVGVLRASGPTSRARTRSGMKLGLHIADFTWDGGPAALGQQLGDVAARAEQA